MALTRGARRPAPSPDSCEEIIDLLSDYMEMTLDPREMTAIRHHLAGCAACARYLETLRTTRDAVAGLRVEEIPPELRRRLRVYLDRRAAIPGKP